MAKLEGLEIGVNEWISSTRISMCTNLSCKYHSINFGCNLKTIELDTRGRCVSREERRLTSRNVLGYFKNKGVEVRDGGEND